MNQRADAPENAALEVSALPSYGFSHRSLVWWGTLGLIAVEATVFGLAIVAYFFLRSHASVWPLNGPPPDLTWGTINTLVMLLSAVPNWLTKRAAERSDRGRARFWLVVCLVFALTFPWMLRVVSGFSRHLIQRLPELIR